MVDYRRFVACFLMCQWNDLLDVNVSMDSKLMIIVYKLIDLGCRRPSEATKKYASVLWMVVSDALQLSNESKKNLRRRLSQTLTDLIKKEAPKFQEFSVLPSPATMKSEYPEIWQTLFPTEEPVPCQVDERVLIGEDSMQKCRPRDCSPQAPMNLSLGGLSLGGLGNQQLEQFGGYMMRSMQQMQETQTKVIELLCGGGR